MALYESIEELAKLASPKSTAVIVVDVQKFFTARPKWPNLDDVLPRMQHFVQEAKHAGVLVVRTQNVVPEDHQSETWVLQLPSMVVQGLAPGSEPTEFHPGFEPASDELHFTKPRYSAFVMTDLEAQLRARDIRTVIVLGLTTDVCVGSTARDAFQRDFRTITLGDCTAERTQARHENGLETLAANFGAVTTSVEILAAWSPQMAEARR
jgi:ureidoacrylate peracid hydrolase